MLAFGNFAGGGGGVYLILKMMWNVFGFDLDILKIKICKEDQSLYTLRNLLCIKSGLKKERGQGNLRKNPNGKIFVCFIASLSHIVSFILSDLGKTRTAIK